MNNIATIINYINKRTNNRFTFSNGTNDKTKMNYFNAYLNDKCIYSLNKRINNSVTKEDINRAVNILNTFN